MFRKEKINNPQPEPESFNVKTGIVRAGTSRVCVPVRLCLLAPGACVCDVRQVTVARFRSIRGVDAQSLCHAVRAWFKLDRHSYQKEIGERNRRLPPSKLLAAGVKPKTEDRDGRGGYV